MVCCPFHSDSDPSMKLNDTYYYCFGCGANGNAIALLPPKRGLTDEQWADIAYCLRVLTDYLDLLHDWREHYKPASPEEPLDERFVEALHMTETVEHLTDCVAFGTPQQKAAAAEQSMRAYETAVDAYAQHGVDMAAIEAELLPARSARACRRCWTR